MAQNHDTMQSDYNHLLTLWTSGVRDYHTMLSDYLTANSIFVAVIGLLVSRESLALPFTLVIVLLSTIGILMSAQMAIVLGRFSGQNALWEWQLRGIESMPDWLDRKPVSSLYRLRERRETIVDETNEPRSFAPSWAFRQHRQWWAHRAISFPWFFGTVYGLFLLWGVTQIARSSMMFG
ncbi:MAG: conserved membrane protein of unknown function [Nitrospira sp.]|nr:MAG: conserved membrane protein of unknown function [Nitrospira sp.]